MFGRQQKDPNPSETPEIPNMMFPSPGEIEDSPQDDTQISQGVKLSQPEPESVQVVEKVSRIISPYFIVIVGLILSEDNFFLGLLLITVGIFSLSKVSWKTITIFLREIKDIFS
jgi:hypothetical protein